MVILPLDIDYIAPSPYGRLAPDPVADRSSPAGVDLYLTVDFAHDMDAAAKPEGTRVQRNTLLQLTQISEFSYRRNGKK